jgi:hypothetical protein
MLQTVAACATNGGRWCYRRCPPALQESRRRWPVLEGADDVAADVSKRLLSSKMQALSKLQSPMAGAARARWCCYISHGLLWQRRGMRALS